MNRRAVALVLLVALTLPLAGCWSRLEINDLAIIPMMAIDRSTSGELQMWIHLVIPTRRGGAAGMQGGSAGGGVDESPFITLTATGATILEAASWIQTQSPRRLFWAHMRVVLIGERMARDGVHQVIDFLTRHRELRPTNYVMVVKGNVADLMATPVDLEGLPVEYLREMSHSRNSIVTRIDDLATDLAAMGSDPTLGVAEVVQPQPGAPKGQHPGLKLAGTALLKEDQLVAIMDEHTTRGLLWLRNEIRRAVVTVALPDVPGHISMEGVTARVRREARFEGGRIVIYIRARAEGDVIEVAANVDISDTKVVKSIEDQMSKEIKARMEAALEMMKELSVDSAGMGEVVHQQLPAVWKGVQKRWLREEFARTQFVVEVDARIRRNGLSTKPRGVKEGELIKGGR